ncbi:uncharacterized protein LOC112574598 [Pomacea canaliculata]|uniref:uncharacterized protein LOC112574598 n=1 Tax=Pomacea canaliculata TaxID=400727 RepID=UPI000D7271FE|nr:uncharacterized protein LOC112574598 [Pomacea canaliculata]
MSHMTAMIATFVLFSFATMTSHAVVAMIAVKTYQKASEQSLTEPEMTLSTQSVIHCAFKCKKYPHCTVFAYDHQLSLCLLRSSMSTTGSANISTDNPLSVYKDTDRHCPHDSLSISHGSVTIQRSVWSVEGNVTCDDDYLLLQTVTSAVTCLDDGSWTSINAQCLKRVWRYPETIQQSPNPFTFPIPGTVIDGWSVCVNGVPTSNSRTIAEIFSGSSSNLAVHTSWRFQGYVSVNDMVRGSWGAQEDVTNPPFPLLVGKPFFLRLTVRNSTIDIYMDNVFFNRHYLKFPLSSFSHINIYGTVNVTKVETWCKE